MERRAAARVGQSGAASGDRAPRSPRGGWLALAREELLDLRLCDLRLPLARSELAERVNELHRELDDAGLRLRPNVWLSTDWFTPDRSTGFAVPFYVAHPRLAHLERSVMFDAEGAAREACMKLLRHEAAHALDNAFGLRRRAGFREVFGRAGIPYRDSYTVEPMSRDHVLHLDRWYAQSHPLEDFAETFAVWLRPGSRWKQTYAGWPALEKLRYVDELARELRGVASNGHTTRGRRVSERDEAISTLRHTLRDHYAAKRARYRIEHPTAHDALLARLFVAPAESGRAGRHGSAARFLSERRAELRRHCAHACGVHPYLVDQVLKEVVLRCRQLRLALPRSPRRSLAGTAAALVRLTLRAGSSRSTYLR